MLGKIAVTYMEWAGSPDQKVIVPWTVLDNSESLMAFADKIASTPLRRAQRTSISSAIDFSVKLLEESGVSATRRVIDVSGDGPNNQGRLVLEARDAALAKGITINGVHGSSPRTRSVHRGDQDQDPARSRRPYASAVPHQPHSVHSAHQLHGRRDAVA
jgi:hypothetical protein